MTERFSWAFKFCIQKRKGAYVKEYHVSCQPTLWKVYDLEVGKCEWDGHGSWK